MGLDMYAYATAERFPQPVDFEPSEPVLIHDWRKHPNLHGWMRQLYRAKGGTSEEFNCDPVALDADDLDQLEQVIRDGSLPETTGFFFGESTGCSEERADDLDFIRKARLHIQDGMTIYYAAWW